MKPVRTLSALLLMTAVATMPASAGPRFFGFFDKFLGQAVDQRQATDSITDLAIATPELSTLVQAVLKAELATTLAEDGAFTVFAPTNDAFEAAGIDPSALDAATLTAVLLDHVVPGDFKPAFLRAQSLAGERITTLGGLTLGIDRSPFAVNGSPIVISDIMASNGRIYVIDGVLTRPAPSIADRAIANPGLSSLVEAVVKADLVETLDEGGPFTAFVPTNEAFERAGIDPAVIDAETLAAVLQDHVVQGEYTAGELFALRTSQGTLRTLGGLDLFFRGMRVNGIRIVATNISASNGVIHLIDGVLLED